jgi:hypothetical protein
MEFLLAGEFAARISFEVIPAGVSS